jgi:hypothetical protein
MSDYQPLQDDIQIFLQTQKTVVHETVRITVNIQAQVDPNQSETDFRKEVQATLRRFITGDWRIQSVQRSKGNQFEYVNVQATVRVADKENYALVTRANAVSRIGFELASPRAEYELTFDEIQAVNAELRLTLLKLALAECAAYNDAFKEAKQRPSNVYRISSTRFDSGNMQNSSVNNARSFNANHVLMAASASPTISSMGGSVGNVYQVEDELSGAVPSDGDEGSADMGVTTRFSMTGNFVLRSVHE